jgi:prepilin-type N-terminal cleavage/methylation domain-containing protein
VEEGVRYSNFIELLIVLAIVGILAAIGIPLYITYSKNKDADIVLSSPHLEFYVTDLQFDRSVMLMELKPIALSNHPPGLFAGEFCAIKIGTLVEPKVIGEYIIATLQGNHTGTYRGLPFCPAGRVAVDKESWRRAHAFAYINAGSYDAEQNRQRAERERAEEEKVLSDRKTRGTDLLKEKGLLGE